MSVSGNAAWNSGDTITATKLQNLETALDYSVDGGLVVESATSVSGEEPDQVESSIGPAIEFANTVTKSIIFTRRWPLSGKGVAVELKVAADTANAGGFRIRISHQVNGGAATNTDVTVTPGNNTSLYSADLGTIIAAGNIALGDLLTIKISRLGADAADTHTGKMRLHHTRLKWV